MSKKDKSAIVSGAGWLGSFSHLLIREMRRQGWSDEEIHTLVTAEPGDQHIEAIVKGMKKLRYYHKILLLKPFTASSVVEAIQRGSYDACNSNIPAFFAEDAVSLDEETYVYLFEFEKDNNMSFKEILDIGEAIGFMPIMPHHIYGIGIQHPKEQTEEEGPIVELGSVKGDGRVLYLDGDPLWRSLCFGGANSTETWWHQAKRVGFIRKPPQK